VYKLVNAITVLAEVSRFLQQQMPP
jgi:hypothetical protein